MSDLTPRAPSPPESGGIAVPPQQQPSNAGPPQQELFQQLLLNQSEELRLRQVQLDLDKQKDSNGYLYAQKSLEVQAADRRHSREVLAGQKKGLYWLILALCAMVTGLVCVALWLGKDAIASEIIKAVVFVSVGFLGGFGVARSRPELPQGTSKPPPPK
jgi:hypothetical protein